MKKSLKTWDEFLEPVPDRLDAITSSLAEILASGWTTIAAALTDRGIEAPESSEAFLAHAAPSLIRIAANENDELYLESEELGHFSPLDLTLGIELQVLAVELA